MRIYDSFDLKIRPWTPVQLQKVLPLVSKLIREYKKLPEDTKTVREMTVIDLFEKMAPVIENSEEYIDELMKIVYLSLQVANKELLVDHAGKKVVVSMFSEEEMRNYLTLPVIIRIAKAILEQNFSKNLFGGSNEVSLVNETEEIPEVPEIPEVKEAQEVQEVKEAQEIKEIPTTPAE